MGWMGRWTGSSPRRARRGARRNELGAFAADWLLVIAAVMGLGGLSAYLVEDYVESHTLERSAEQRDLTAYVDDGRALNTEHRMVRHAAAAVAAVVEEAVSADPDDPRFPVWRDWASHFDAKCRRLALVYRHLDGFTVHSLFLPPLRPKNTPSEEEYRREPSRARDPLDADELAEADTTPYDQGATAADLETLSNRKKIMLGFFLARVTPENPGGTRQVLVNSLFKGAVAWCYLPRSISATAADGGLDERNPLLAAAEAYAEGVAGSAKVDDPENPGDKALPGTWRNWASHWDAKCRRAVDVFSDLRGFTVESTFRRPPGAPSAEELIHDPDRPHRLPFLRATARCRIVAA